MSLTEFNSNAQYLAENVDWGKSVGYPAAYGLTRGDKSLFGGIKVFGEMIRLGTPACEDLAYLFDKYRGGPPAAPTDYKPQDLDDAMARLRARKR